jgi:predicted amidophosphoribosyltransferase
MEDINFGEWWWCPECGEPIEVCASYGTCPNSQISKSHVQSNTGLQADGVTVCPTCELELSKDGICPKCFGQYHPAAKA